MIFRQSFEMYVQTGCCPGPLSSNPGHAVLPSRHDTALHCTDYSTTRPSSTIYRLGPLITSAIIQRINAINANY